MTKNYRPIEVKILTIIIVILGFWNAIRFIQGLLFWHTLTMYHVQSGPLYIVIFGAVWAVIGIILCWPIWMGKTWAWGATIGALIAYLFWSIFDRFLLQEPHGNEFFTWFAIIALTLFVILLIFSGNLRDYYHDQKKQKRST